MNPALWGGICALNLGVADFLARFSSRAIGASSALLGMLLVGFATLILWAIFMSPPMVWETSSSSLGPTPTSVGPTAASVKSLVPDTQAAESKKRLTSPSLDSVTYTSPVADTAMWNG